MDRALDMKKQSRERSCEELEEEKIVEQLLEKQCGFYRAVLELSRSEYEKFSKQRPLKEIISIIKKKKILLSCVEEIEKKLELIKTHRKEIWEAILNNERPCQLFSQVQELVREMLAIDEENQGMLQKYMKGLQKKQSELSKESF